MRVHSCHLLIIGICLMNLSTAKAQNWPRFRGPNGTGVSDAVNIPAKWTDEDYNWKVELPGLGNSSPVVWGKKLFITGADVSDGKRHLLCLDTISGKELWRKTYAFEKYKSHSNNSYASNTPALDADHVYVLWQSKSECSLVTLDHDGNEVWKLDFGKLKTGHGAATSPIVFEDSVVVCNDQDGPSFLLAVDRSTGKEQWRVPRSGKRACYSTPCVFQPDGESPELIFTHSYQGITSINPKTGKRNWNIEPFGTHPQRACGSPIVVGDLVIGSSGFTTAEKNVVVLRPKQSDSGYNPNEIYRVTKLAPHVPTPLVYKDRMYLWTDIGIVSCIKLQTGEVVWQKRVGGNFFGSPVCVNGRIYNADKHGKITVLAASDDYKLLAHNELNEGTFSTPAVADGVMYWRTESHLMSLGGK